MSDEIVVRQKTFHCDCGAKLKLTVRKPVEIKFLLEALDVYDWSVAVPGKQIYHCAKCNRAHRQDGGEK